MLKLLANENIPRLLVARLRERGHDIVWIREGQCGISDPVVLIRAQLEDRVLLTGDKDFGELVYRLREPTFGVLLLRLGDLSSIDKASLVCTVIDSHADELPSSFSVLTSKSLRVRGRLAR